MGIVSSFPFGGGGGWVNPHINTQLMEDIQEQKKSSRH